MVATCGDAMNEMLRELDLSASPPGQPDALPQPLKSWVGVKPVSRLVTAGHD